jgi:hypothetical protein
MLTLPGSSKTCSVPICKMAGLAQPAFALVTEAQEGQGGSQALGQDPG